jgi:hypothetical protein
MIILFITGVVNAHEDEKYKHGRYPRSYGHRQCADGVRLIWTNAEHTKGVHFIWDGELCHVSEEMDNPVCPEEEE